MYVQNRLEGDSGPRGGCLWGRRVRWCECRGEAMRKRRIRRFSPSPPSQSVLSAQCSGAGAKATSSKKLSWFPSLRSETRQYFIVLCKERQEMLPPPSSLPSLRSCTPCPPARGPRACTSLGALPALWGGGVTVPGPCPLSSLSLGVPGSCRWEGFAKEVSRGGRLA